LKFSAFEREQPHDLAGLVSGGIADPTLGESQSLVDLEFVRCHHGLQFLAVVVQSPL
jgi:hypothetical protein